MLRKICWLVLFSQAFVFLLGILVFTEVCRLPHHQDADTKDRLVLVLLAFPRIESHSVDPFAELVTHVGEYLRCNYAPFPKKQIHYPGLPRDPRISPNYAILPNEGRILQSLNLKNPRAYSLASEISHLTGESLTSVVITALEQRLAEERRKRGGSTTAERILAFADRFAPGMATGSQSAQHAADLYGDDGLPQ